MVFVMDLCSTGSETGSLEKPLHSQLNAAAFS